MSILTAELAGQIVRRTMQIIPFNVNVMDGGAVILGSGDAARIGQLHDGALLVLSQQRTVEIDSATADKLHGVKPGINLPLCQQGRIVGVVGLTGAPDEVRRYGELVRLAAEMILEQAQLAAALQRDARHREAFVLELIRCQPGKDALLEAWARRIGFRPECRHAAILLRLERADCDPDAAQHLLQRMQTEVAERWPNTLSATVDPYEMVLVERCADAGGEGALRQRLQALAAWAAETSPYRCLVAMGIALPGCAGLAQSWLAARTTARIGLMRDPSGRAFCYDDLALPVLLSELDHGWQAQQLRAPLARLQGEEGAALRDTLAVWFGHDCRPVATARALGIHRNTLDYRLRRIADASGLDPERSEDRLRLYIALLLGRPARLPSPGAAPHST